MKIFSRSLSSCFGIILLIASDLAAVASDRSGAPPENPIDGVVILGAEEIESITWHANEPVRILVPFLEKRKKELTEALLSYLGKPITHPAETNQAMLSLIASYCYKADHPFVAIGKVNAPRLEGGETKEIKAFRVVEVKMRDINYNMESWKLLKRVTSNHVARVLNLQSNSIVPMKDLRAGLTDLNANSGLLKVSTRFEPAEDRKPLVDVDVDIYTDGVQGYVGYENSGNRFVGQNRLTLGGTALLPAFDRPSYLNYQFLSDVEFSSFLSHSFGYKLPLMNRHSVLAFGNYSDTDVDLTDFGLPASNVGQNLVFGGRYYYQLPEVTEFSLRKGLPYIQSIQHKVSAGWDYKSLESELEFAGSVIQTVSPIEIMQAVLGYNLIALDSLGETEIDLQGFYSPGGLTDKNDRNTFLTARTGGADAEYFYARLVGTRTFRPEIFGPVYLRHDGFAQFTGDRLVPSESVGLGGMATVRGYDEGLISGDTGWYLRNEVRFKIAENWLAARHNRWEAFGFFDIGSIAINQFSATADNFERKTLSSVGVGTEFWIGDTAELALDFGVPLRERNFYQSLAGYSGNDYRAHLSLRMNF